MKFGDFQAIAEPETETGELWPDDRVKWMERTLAEEDGVKIAITGLVELVRPLFLAVWCIFGSNFFHVSDDYWSITSFLFF
eukprot:COSAG01_NODE_1254_length_11042_cov_37.493192_3_plen_81_part_00